MQTSGSDKPAFAAARPVAGSGKGQPWHLADLPREGVLSWETVFYQMESGRSAGRAIGREMSRTSCLFTLALSVPSSLQPDSCRCAA